MVMFEDENGTDSDKAMENASRNLANFAWDETDLDFYFSQIEARMAAVGVKKQFTKFQVLSMILPPKVVQSVKKILRKKEADFTGDHANRSYKQLKKELMRIYGPRLEAGVERALTRTLTSTPSELARNLMDDICQHEMDCACCPAVILALWKKHLPVQVRAAIAGQTFDNETFDAVCELADQVFETCRPAGVSIAAASLDETQPAIPYATAAINGDQPVFSVNGQNIPVQQVVAALGGFRGGRGRGSRGGYRGSGNSRGNQNNSNRGGRGNGGGGQSGGQSQGQGQGQGRGRRGPRHPDQPPHEACSMHWKHGKSSYFCSDPHVCPWVNKTIPRPADNK